MSRQPKTNILGYVFPIILAFIVILIFAQILFRGWDSTPVERANVSYAYASPATGDAKVFIQKRGDKRDEVTTNSQVLENQLVQVDEGTGSFTLANSQTNIHLGTATKLRYLGQEGVNHVVRLENKEIWTKVAEPDIKIDLVNYQVLPSSDSVFDISKNNLFTTITVLSGMVTVRNENYTGEITAGKQVQIQSFKTLEESFASLALLSNEFRLSDWYVLNNGAQYETSAAQSNATTSGIAQSATSRSSGAPILFEFPQDEATVESADIVIQGRILSTLVSRITIGSETAQIDYVNNSFVFPEMTLDQKQNELIYRVFSADGTLMHKGVLTVYLSQAPAGSGSGWDLATADNYPAPKAWYLVISPDPDYHVTSDNVVRVDGVVPAGQVDHIIVNDFRLSKFPSGGTDWYYFANAQFGNLNPGMNLYEIKYYDDSDEIIHRQLFVIKKVEEIAEEE